MNNYLIQHRNIDKSGLAPFSVYKKNRICYGLGMMVNSKPTSTLPSSSALSMIRNDGSVTEANKNAVDLDQLVRHPVVAATNLMIVQEKEDCLEEKEGRYWRI